MFNTPVSKGNRDVKSAVCDGNVIGACANVLGKMIPSAASASMFGERNAVRPPRRLDVVKVIFDECHQIEDRVNVLARHPVIIGNAGIFSPLADAEITPDTPGKAGIAGQDK